MPLSFKTPRTKIYVPMNKNIIIILLLFVALPTWAQLDRSQKPEPGPAPEINLGEAESFTLSNGMKVFVVENHKLPRVAFSLVLDNDPVLEKENAGYISMAGQLLRNGTTSKTKAELDEAVDFLGATLSTSSSGAYASSLKKHADKIMALMAEVVLHPSFPEDELEKIKKQTLSALEANKDDADAIAADVAQVLRYGKDHPYGEVVTEETVKNIDLAEIKQYYDTYFRPNNAYLAVVGDITKKEAEKLIKKYFGQWKKGDVPSATYPVPAAPEERIIALVDRPNAVQSVISVTYPVELKPGDTDVIKSMVMNQILGGSFSSRLNMNLREKHGYTYGANSSLGSDKLVGSFRASSSVRNEVTDSTIIEFLHELNDIKQKNVTEEELQDVKNYLTGSFARSLENPATIANFAINIERYHLPKDYYVNYLKNIDAVSLEDVQQMAEKYITPDRAYVLVVGKGEEVADRIKGFGKLQYFDIYGNPYTPEAKASLPEGLTAEKVIEGYLSALGGKDNLRKIKDISMVLQASIQGNPVEIVQTAKAPNKSLNEVKMGGMVVQKEVYNGQKAVSYQMGQEIPMTEEQMKESAYKSVMFPELEYEQWGVETALKGMEKVDGKDAYVVEVVLPTGTTSTQYYSAETGLKVKETMHIDTPQGNMVQNISYADYKEKSGVKFPHKVTLSPPNFTAEISALEINQGVDDKVFAIE